MTNAPERSGGRYAVVVNCEAQYSIWPTRVPPPPGWSATGYAGTLNACLGQIERAWTDMRPASLRAVVDQPRTDEHDTSRSGSMAVRDRTHRLVARLSRGEHCVHATGMRRATLAGVRKAIESGSLLLSFSGTGGGTELELRLDAKTLRRLSIPGELRKGYVRLAGTISLNDETRRCIVRLDTGTLAGTGHLVPNNNNPQARTRRERQHEQIPLES